MQIKLLGPFIAREHHGSIVPSAAKPRQILALLALRSGGIVPAATLMEELWGDRSPRSAPTTLQTYILKLRRLLEQALTPGDDLPGISGDGRPHAKEVLMTRHGGYQLDVEPGAIDAQEFERLQGFGQSAFAAGDFAAASTLLRQALALWRGPALVDVRTGLVLDIEVLRLEEARMTALESRIAADLRLGRYGQVLSELAVLTAQHPLHEGLHAQFMAAQYASGRVWQALQTYQRLRATLGAELGIAPSARVRRLYEAMLAADSSLDAGVPAGPVLRSPV
ncbi:AfsR/SARP family transcriptional regulator [Streptomyces geranii]|uniref:AfsR/SARP family transcriptional regulator n=1 Tax=Streptomyces geranii TaxID=2058923 RepID=UPI0018E59BFC|nr:AfsR/SARP family transcriptional regulator [Streptomyces geranii]